jgi:hypothetical protein
MVKNELGRIGKEKVVAPDLTGGTEEHHKRPHDVGRLGPVSTWATSQHKPNINLLS